MPIDPTKTLDLVACPRPFETAQVVRQINAGGTITEILCAEGMGGVVTGHWLEAVVEINGQPVAAEYWSRVRPKDG